MAIALVTGASGTRSGIGFGNAITLARAGHTVIATMRNPEAAGELPGIVATEQLPVTIMALDVDDDVSVTQTFERAPNQHGRVDVLVNNAGIGGPGTIDDTPLASFRRIMETNYFGPLCCIKAVLPDMVARRSGCIINISSVVGRIAISPQAPYAASKHALEALSECLAQEFKAFNVRVALVEPGPIATPMAQKILTGQPKSTCPQGRRLAALFAAFLKQPTSRRYARAAPEVAKGGCSAVLPGSAALPRRHRGMWDRAPLGARNYRARPRGEAPAAELCETVCEAGQDGRG
jgi:NAD(P)-dependent dehydrogenase (short-subunit alcohol dehydrogenase family)